MMMNTVFILYHRVYPEVPWGAEQQFPEGYIRGTRFLLFWECLVYCLAMYTVILAKPCLNHA